MNPSNNAGSDGWKQGDLRRYLPPVPLAQISSTTDTSEAAEFVLTLQGLSDVLTAHIAVGAITRQASGSQTPVLPADYPAAPGCGTMQLTPVIKNPELPRLYLREVFQDPTATDNANNPLPQDLPFGWSFEPQGADEVRIVISVPANGYAASGLNAVLACVVTLSYSGDWQDVKAVERALSAVRLMGEPADTLVLGSGGG